MDERSRTAAGYGRIGFANRPSGTNWELKPPVHMQGSVFGDNSLMTPSTQHSSLVHSDSRGLCVRRKQVVVRD